MVTGVQADFKKRASEVTKIGMIRWILTARWLLRNRFSVCTTEGIVLFSAKAREETQVVKRQAKQHRKCE